MNATQILNLNTTKADKIRKLVGLGYTRTEIARMLGIGYGQVQNVYAKMNQTTRTRTTRIAGFTLPTFNRKFGVEIEFFGTGGKAELERLITSKGLIVKSELYNHETRPHWKITSDSSIAPSKGIGLEIVSPILQGAEGIEQLKKICEALNEWGALINKSCGVHIHFNAADFELQTWKNIYKNYIISESTIDSMMPVSRRANNNIYCKSLTVLRDKDTAFHTIDSSNTIKEMARAISGESRYSKVNAQSYFRHSTIEFRQHSGSVEFQKMSKWIEFLHGIVSYSEAGKFLENGRLEDMKIFLKEETANFYFNRIQDLAS